MELRHLRYFLAVAREGSFTRGAEALRISQPTLSQQIRDLERETGGPLFVRHPNGVELTPAGSALIPLAQNALRAVQTAVLTARDVGGRGSGVLTIGIVPGSSSHHLMSFMDGYSAAQPGIAVRPREVAYFQAPELLSLGELDVVLTRLPLDRERFAWRVLTTEPLELFVGRGHPLAEAGELPVEEVLDTVLIPGPPQVDQRLQDYWFLNRYRNGEPPRLAQGGALTVLDYLYQVMGGSGGAVATPSIRAAIGLGNVPSVRLLGTRPNSSVVAIRREERRTEVHAFCVSAVQISRALGVVAGRPTP